MKESKKLFPHYICCCALAGIALQFTACSDSHNSVASQESSHRDSQRDSSTVRPVAAPLPPIAPQFQDYDQARSLASSQQERDAVDLAGAVHGTVARGEVDSDDLSAMRKVLTQSQTPEVRAAAAAGLGKAMDPDGMPALLDAMEDESPLVRKAAGDAVERMIGLGRRFQADGPSESRRQVIAAYRLFWREARHGTYYQILKDPSKKEEMRRQAIHKIKQRKRRERRAAQ